MIQSPWVHGLFISQEPARGKQETLLPLIRPFPTKHGTPAQMVEFSPCGETFPSRLHSRAGQSQPTTFWYHASRSHVNSLERHDHPMERNYSHFMVVLEFRRVWQNCTWYALTCHVSCSRGESFYAANCARNSCEWTGIGILLSWNDLDPRCVSNGFLCLRVRPLEWVLVLA